MPPPAVPVNATVSGWSPAIGLALAPAVSGERLTVTAGALAVVVCPALSETVSFAVNDPAVA